MIREDAALAFLDAMKERARYEAFLRFTYSLPGHRQVGVTYCPDMNYGRYHAPDPGLEGFSYRWAYYTPAFYARDTHVEAPERGWRGLATGPLGEREALTLLMGGTLPDAAPDENDALFADVAARSAQEAAYAGGPLAHSVFRYTGTRE